jgi:hypothetical protein
MRANILKLELTTHILRMRKQVRDQAVYVPREKGASSLARYHAMRYPYGENKNKLGKIIREEINKIL